MPDVNWEYSDPGTSFYVPLSLMRNPMIKIHNRLALAIMVALLSLASGTDAQTLVPGNAYRVTTRNVTGTTIVYCYRLLDSNVFEVKTTTAFVLTSTGTWETLPTAGHVAASFFQANTATPLSTTTYIGAAYTAPGSINSTISGTVLTDVAGTIVPAVFTGILDPTCAN